MFGYWARNHFRHNKQDSNMALFTLFKSSSVDFSTLYKNKKTQLSQNDMAMLAYKGFCNDNYKCPHELWKQEVFWTRKMLWTLSLTKTFVSKRHVSNNPTQAQRVKINVSIIYKKTNSSEQVKAKKWNTKVVAQVLYTRIATTTTTDESIKYVHMWTN